VGSGWAEIVNGVGGSSNVHVAVSHGHAWVMTTSLLLFGVFGAEYRTGGAGWRPFRQIYPPGTVDGGFNAFTPDGSLAPRGGAFNVVMDDAGRAAAVWTASQPEGPFLVDLRYSSGTWSDPEPIELLASDATVGSLGLAGAPDGHALAIWAEDHTTTPAPTLKVSSLSPGGTWTTPAEPWSAPVAGTPSLPRVTTGASGRAMAVWLQTGGAALDGGAVSRIWGSTLAAGATGWSAPEAVSSHAVMLAGADGPIVVGSDDTGNGLATWIDISSTPAVKSARFVAGTGWTENGAISGTSPPTMQLQIAVDPWGRALAVWPGSMGDIWAARFE